MIPKWPAWGSKTALTLDFGTPLILDHSEKSRERADLEAQSALTAQIAMKKNKRKGTRTKHKGHKGDSNGLPPRRNTDPQTAGPQWAPKGEKANRRPPRIRANLGASTISQPPSAHEACARPKRHQRNELQGEPKNTKILGPSPNPKGKATHIPKTKNVRQILTPCCKAALTNV